MYILSLVNISSKEAAAVWDAPTQQRVMSDGFL